MTQLLVNFGRLDLSQQIALGNLAANVFGPALHVTAGASGNRRLHKALQRPGQRQRLTSGTAPGLNRRHVLTRLLSRAGVQRLRIGHAAQHRAPGTQREQQQHHQGCDLGPAHDLAAFQQFDVVFPRFKLDRVQTQGRMALLGHGSGLLRR